jgi:hypothetical protein
MNEGSELSDVTSGREKEDRVRAAGHADGVLHALGIADDLVNKIVPLISDHREAMEAVQQYRQAASVERDAAEKAQAIEASEAAATGHE